MSQTAAALAATFPSPSVINALLLLTDALFYFAVLAALFRARYRVGIGAFFLRARRDALSRNLSGQRRLCRSAGLAWVDRAVHRHL